MTDDLADGDTSDYDKHQAEGHAFYRVIEAYVAEYTSICYNMVFPLQSHRTPHKHLARHTCTWRTTLPPTTQMEGKVHWLLQLRYSLSA
ncbi:MAG: hypothetical protein Ct9H90mP24_0680 [Methanobacteriota archaeon]|nr:MAG: hypothetical protein Ct9H90mP24_0680 [Euryarchaeota archaeon]